jgi:hypothetical protein
MRIFAEKRKTTKQATPAKSTLLDRARLGHSQEVDTILRMQETIGNQAVQRLLKANRGDSKGYSTDTRVSRAAGATLADNLPYTQKIEGVGDPPSIDDKDALAQTIGGIPGTLTLTKPGAAAAQPTASFAAGAVHAVNNVAVQVARGVEAGKTLMTLNGKDLLSTAPGTAIAKPSIGGSSLASGGVQCRVAAVPKNVGSFDETVLNSGPWSTVTSKANLQARLRLAACSGTGDTTLTAHGQPSDAKVAEANRTHEDHHAADFAAVFAKTIGRWDALLGAAKSSGTTFKGADAPACEGALFAAMGGTPESIATNYRDGCRGSGRAFHNTPAGGPLSVSNQSADATCTSCSVDVSQ